MTTHHPLPIDTPSGTLVLVTHAPGWGLPRFEGARRGRLVVISRRSAEVELEERIDSLDDHHPDLGPGERAWWPTSHVERVAEVLSTDPERLLDQLLARRA